MQKQHFNPQDVSDGKLFNEQPTAGDLPPIPIDETLAAISRIDALVTKSRELLAD